MERGLVSAGHIETARAAQAVLQAGGNAFDAAVAAAFAACAAEPVFTSLGGGGFLLARAAGRPEILYDFFVQTPKRRRPSSEIEFYPIHADFGPTTQEFHVGMGSVATPGMIAGLLAVHGELGSLPIAEVVAPARHLAREGVLVTAFQEYLFQVVRPIYLATEEARRVFQSAARPGELPRDGERIRFPELADTIDTLAQRGAAWFYEGEGAELLAEQSRDLGHVTREDLKSYRVERRKPLEFFYRGRRLLTNPPPSCGGILIAFTLGLLEKSGTAPAAAGSPEDLFPLAAAMDLTNQARLDGLALDPEWRRSELLLDPDLLGAYAEQIASRPRAPRGTTHLNVVDAAGNMAALSLSNGEGCGRVLRGTGIMLNNMLGEEDLSPRGFQSWTTDLRMSSMMAPTFLFPAEGGVTAMGSGGSNRIRTAIVQVLRGLTDHSRTLREAVEAPRIHFEKGLLSWEPGFPPETVRELEAAYPQNHPWAEKNLFFGGVQAAAFHPGLGCEGAGDPRRAGVCLLA